jgi:hypothetical protein
MPVTTTTTRQPLAATPTTLTVINNDRNGYCMISEVDVNGQKTTLWIVDNIQATDDHKGAQVHIYTVSGTGNPSLSGTITLPAIDSRDALGKTQWKQGVHRPLVAVGVTSLRLQGNNIWATDLQNGTIYRFDKTATSGNAEIVFFKALPDSVDTIPLQFFDVAFQPKGASSRNDRLWVGDAYADRINVYSIDLPAGFDGPFPTAIADYTAATSLSGTVKDKPSTFQELVFNNDVLWLMTQDASSAPSPEGYGLIQGDTQLDGTLGAANFIPVKNASTMAASGDNLYIGTSTGALYLKDISPAKRAAPPVQIHADDSDFSHTQMFVEPYPAQSGYIWSSTQDSPEKINCYSPAGTLSRRYTIQLTSKTPRWKSPISLHDGKRIAVIDLDSPTLGVFTVDAAFFVGDFDLKFNPTEMTVDTKSAVNNLPLRAYVKGNAGVYGKDVSATLTEKDLDDHNTGHTFPLPPEDLAVDIDHNKTSVALVAPVKAGDNKAEATVTAEARTTGLNHALLTLHVKEHKLAVKPDNTKKDQNHAHGASLTEFDIRQGITNSLPDVLIEAGTTDDVEVEIKNSTGMSYPTKADFGGSVKKSVPKDANGKAVPDIQGGDTVGTASVVLHQSGMDSTPVSMNILPLADNVVSGKMNIATNNAALLDLVNKVWGLLVQGHTVKGDTGTPPVPAPKTLVQIKLVSPDTKLVMNLKGSPVVGTVTLLSDDKGSVPIHANQLEITYPPADINKFDAKQAHFEVQYDTTGQLGGEAANITAASWSTVKIVPFPQHR